MSFIVNETSYTIQETSVIDKAAPQKHSARYVKRAYWSPTKGFEIRIFPISFYSDSEEKYYFNDEKGDNSIYESDVFSVKKRKSGDFDFKIYWTVKGDAKVDLWRDSYAFDELFGTVKTFSF